MRGSFRGWWMKEPCGVSWEARITPAPLLRKVATVSALCCHRSVFWGRMRIHGWDVRGPAMSEAAWLKSLRAGRGVCPLFGADVVVARFAEIVSVERSERLVMVPASSQRPLLGTLPVPPDVRTRWLGSA